MLSTIVTSSAAGNASHTPVIPNAADSTNANMRIAAKPLMIDDAKAHLTASTALSADVATIFTPANKNPRKYSLTPSLAYAQAPYSSHC